MTRPDLDNLMEFSVLAAEGAGSITRSHFGSVGYDVKGDGSEVTIADREAEDFLRRTIQDRFPDHGVFGEEGARVEGKGEYRWILDPIDGTRSFASGIPLYGVLIALEHRGSPILGCAHFPELGETIVAATGAGCWKGNKAVRVSECLLLSEARVVTSGLEYWRDWATPLGKKGLERLIEGSRFGRTWGDSYGYILVATGRAEIMADPASGSYWDYAPMIPIIGESGGQFTALNGAPIAAWSSALATNGLLHDSAMQCWGSVRSDLELQTASVRERASG